MFVQAAAECVEDNGAGVAVVLVVARNDHDGLGILLEPSQTFIKPGTRVKAKTAAGATRGGGDSNPYENTACI
jgi:hypothetical protein